MGPPRKWESQHNLFFERAHRMISTYSHQKELHEERLRLKTSEQQLQNRISTGTNCSVFESRIIVDIAKEAFAFGEYSDNRSLTPGQMVYLAVHQMEPPGKPIRECQMVRVTLTLLENSTDWECKSEHGTKALRHVQIQRMTEEAREQGGLLTQEDLGRILGTDVRTIRTDIQEIKEQGILVPTRGQQKDIGPGVTHKEQAIRLYIQGKEPLEIARAIKHSLRAVERYVHTFCRTVYCQQQMRNSLHTAKVVGISLAAVQKNLEIYEHYRNQENYCDLIALIEKDGGDFWDAGDFKKKRGLSERKKI